MLLVVQYVRPGIGNRPSYGNVPGILVLVHYVVIRTYREFGRSVAVYDLQVSLFNREHFLPAHQHVFHGELKLVDQFQPKLGTEGAPGNAVLVHVIVQHDHVLSHFGRDHMYAGSGR